MLQNIEERISQIQHFYTSTPGFHDASVYQANELQSASQKLPLLVSHHPTGEHKHIFVDLRSAHQNHPNQSCAWNPKQHNII